MMDAKTEHSSRPAHRVKNTHRLRRFADYREGDFWRHAGGERVDGAGQGWGSCRSGRGHFKPYGMRGCSVGARAGSLPTAGAAVPPLRAGSWRQRLVDRDRRQRPTGEVPLGFGIRGWIPQAPGARAAEIARPAWAALGPQANEKRPLTMEDVGRCLRRSGVVFRHSAGGRRPRGTRCRSRARTRAGAGASGRAGSRWCACSRSRSRSGRR